MKIILKPTVHLLSMPQFFRPEEYELPSDGSDNERLIATAGKLCYDSYGKDGRPVTEHVRNLVSQLHFSVIEHVNVGVLLTGISRGLSHELVRHRHFSFSQRSTRYTEESGAAIVLDPYYAKLYSTEYGETNTQWPADPQDKLSLLELEEAAMLHQFLDHCKRSLEIYRTQVDWLMQANPDHLRGTALRKWARGKARQALPHALETRVVMTGNLRSWREFFVKRANPHAEEEIRQLAGMIYHEILPVATAAFHGLRVDQDPQGYRWIQEVG